MNLSFLRKIVSVRGVIKMTNPKHQNKENQAMQKGERRERLHKNQDNRGDDKNKPEYKDFNGDPIE
jgi:hypothetical protein